MLGSSAWNKLCFKHSEGPLGPGPCVTMVRVPPVLCGSRSVPSYFKNSQPASGESFAQIIFLTSDLARYRRKGIGEGPRAQPTDLTWRPMFASQVLTHFDRQRFLTQDVHNRQYTELHAEGLLVCHKVHAPSLDLVSLILAWRVATILRLPGQFRANQITAVCVMALRQFVCWTKALLHYLGPNSSSIITSSPNSSSARRRSSICLGLPPPS